MYLLLGGHFTLWPKAKRRWVCTNYISRNQKFSLSILHVGRYNPKRLSPTKLSTWQEKCPQCDRFSKEVWVKLGVPNYDREALEDDYLALIPLYSQQSLATQ